MYDPRIRKQAELLVDYSTRVKAGDVVQIVGNDVAKPLILALYRRVLSKKPKEVIVHVGLEELGEIYLDDCEEEQLRKFPEIQDHEMKHTDVWIGIIASRNTRSLSETHPQKITIRQSVLRPILDHRVDHTRWVLTLFPTEALAQEADMSFAKYFDFAMDAIVGVDWKKIEKEQKKLKKIFEAGDKVRIVGEGTDLTLSIKGRTVISAHGESNMPDGEVFTSSIENSATGYIHYTYPIIYHGREVVGVRLWFEDGKVTKAKADKGEDFLHHMLDSDHGARFIGELGIGNNYHIDRFTKNILYDEKIGGSIHIALGRSYKDTGGKNVSSIHWDMIKDLRTQGELYLDGKLIQKKGKWLI